MEDCAFLYFLCILCLLSSYVAEKGNLRFRKFHVCKDFFKFICGCLHERAVEWTCNLEAYTTARSGFFGCGFNFVKCIECS